VPKGTATQAAESDTTLLWRARLPRSYVNFLGRKLLRFIKTLQGIGAFLLITFGVVLRKRGSAARVVRPLVFEHVARSGLFLLPLASFVSLALGLVVIGQAVTLLNRFGVANLLGTVMVSAVVRELGPLLAAALVLCRAGAANIVELGTARAQGEVESLESLGIDPIHYLVVPRVVGMAFGMFALTVYLILGAILSGYLWAFVQDVPLRPDEYFRQLAGALTGLDFLLLGAKTFAFGTAIAAITCYHGLAQPLALDGVSRATVRAVGQSLIACAVIDAAFIIIYLTA